MFDCWLITCLIVAGATELLCGLYGCGIPWLMYAAFYGFVFRRWPVVLLVSCLVGCVQELAMGRTFPLCLLLLPVLAVLAQIWRWLGGHRERVQQSLPGACIGLLYAGTADILRWHAVGVSAGWWQELLRSALIGAVACPLLYFLLDRWAGTMALSRYSHVAMGHGEDRVLMDEGDESWGDDEGILD